MNNTRLATCFSALFGAFLGLGMLKFGNPPIMEKWVEAPTDFYEWLLGSPWPIAWAYRLLGVLSILGLIIGFRTAKIRPNVPGWFICLPLLWLACQVLAASRSVEDQLSWPTLKHFVACLVCFYLGLYALARVHKLAPFWIGLFCAFLMVLVVGWEQHFGGLAATREYFFREIYPQMKDVSPEYLKKIASNRIFSTLFYPNSLAGALLLFLPIILMLVAKVDRLFTAPARCLLSGLLAIAALGCLFWSGSKGGWLLMLLLSLVAVLRVPFRKSLKIAILSGVLLAGLSGFAWKYVTFFQKGATSVSARFDYWEAAFKTACANPLFGTGPGTFQIPYKALKRPESEMTRLVHNDYLEQASDSGWLGFFTFTAFVVGGMYFAIKPTHKTVPAGQTSTPDSAGKPNRPSPMPSKQRTRNSTGTIAPCSKSDLSEGPDRWWTFSIWLGLLGWALQSLFDFGLYIPALAWPAFTLLGLLLGRTRIASTKQDVAHNLPARHENPVPQRA